MIIKTDVHTRATRDDNGIVPGIGRDVVDAKHVDTKPSDQDILAPGDVDGMVAVVAVCHSPCSCPGEGEDE